MLQQAFDAAAKLPPAERDLLAARVLAELAVEDDFDQAIATSGVKLVTLAAAALAEEQSQIEVEEDPFAEDDEWFAASVRQLFRAHRAGDAKAVELTLFRFQYDLTSTLGRHLAKDEPVWDNVLRPSTSYRWFDGFEAEPSYSSQGRLRLRGEVCWVSV